MNTNVTITNEQKAKIEAISRQTGIAADDLVREAIDRMIVEKRAATPAGGREGGWRNELLAVAGIWEDRDDIETIMRAGRELLRQRDLKLHRDA